MYRDYLRLTFKNALFSSVFIIKGGIAANEEKKQHINLGDKGTWIYSSV